MDSKHVGDSRRRGNWTLFDVVNRTPELAAMWTPPQNLAFRWFSIDAHGSGGNCGLQALGFAFDLMLDPANRRTIYQRMRQNILRIRNIFRSFVKGARETTHQAAQRTLNELANGAKLSDEDLAFLSIGYRDEATTVGYGVVPIMFRIDASGNLLCASNNGYVGYASLRGLLRDDTMYCLLQEMSNPNDPNADHWRCIGAENASRERQTLFFRDELPPGVLAQFEQVQRYRYVYQDSDGNELFVTPRNVVTYNAIAGEEEEKMEPPTAPISVLLATQAAADATHRSAQQPQSAAEAARFAAARQEAARGQQIAPQNAIRENDWWSDDESFEPTEEEFEFDAIPIGGLL